MIFNTFIALITVFVCGASAQIQFPGPCPNHPVVENFDLARYLGQWFEIEKYFTPFQIGSKCDTARYLDYGNGSVQVYNTLYNSVTNQFFDITGTARPVNASSTEARLLVSFPSVGGQDAPYNVLDTDYTSYAIVWGCRNGGGNNLQSTWFLSRNRNPDNRTRGYVRGFQTALKINTNLLLTTVQDCTN